MTLRFLSARRLAALLSTFNSWFLVIVRCSFLVLLMNPAKATDLRDNLIGRLQSEGAESHYLEARVSKITEALFKHSVTMNDFSYGGGARIFIVKPTIATEILKDMGLPTLGRATAYEREELVLISEDHLKELVTLAHLVWKRDLDTRVAVAEVSIRGLSALRELWDPMLNSALHSDEIEAWSTALRGALAFLIAHEVAHIALGADDPANIRNFTTFISQRDRDLRWMCPDLVHARALQNQSIEQKADELATRLLARHRIANSRFGRYEPGSEWYVQVLVARRFACAASKASQQVRTQVLIPLYGKRLVDRLMAQPPDYCMSSAGVVRSFYPADHPASLARLLAQSDPAESRLLAAFAQRVNRECEDVAARAVGGDRSQHSILR